MAQTKNNIPQIRFKGFYDEWEKKFLKDIFIERHQVSTITKEYPQLSFTIADGVIKPEDRKSNKRDFLIIDKENKKYLITEYDDIIYNPANVIFGAIHRNALCKGVVSPIYKIFFTEYDSSFMDCIVRNQNFINKMTQYLEGTVTKLKTLKPQSFLSMSAFVSPKKRGTKNNRTSFLYPRHPHHHPPKEIGIIEKFEKGVFGKDVPAKWKQST